MKVVQTLDELRASLRDANVQAWLRLIREGESDPDSDDAYWALFGWNRKHGGPTFADASTHPRQAIMSAWGWTSAAGAYQAMAAVPGKVKTDTWDNARDWFKARGYQLTMSRVDQDLFAVWCTARRGALLAVKEGQIETAMALCNLEWASLPGSTHGQPTRAAERLLAVYRRFGGTINAPAPAAGTIPAWGGSDAAAAPSVAGAPSMPAGEAPDWVPPAPKEQSMPIPAVVTALLPSLIEAAPNLIRIFGSGSAVSERNAKAAEAVAGIARSVTGQATTEGAVQVIQSDPDVAAKYREQVHQSMGELLGHLQQAVEIDDKSRAVALDRNLALGQATGGKWLYLLALSALVILVSTLIIAAKVMFSESGFMAETKALVLGQIVIAGFAAVIQWLFGSNIANRISQRDGKGAEQ